MHIAVVFNGKQGKWDIGTWLPLIIAIQMP